MQTIATKTVTSETAAESKLTRRKLALADIAHKCIDIGNLTTARQAIDGLAAINWLQSVEQITRDKEHSLERVCSKLLR